MALAGPAPQPTPYAAVGSTTSTPFRRRFQIELPAEVVLAAEDQATNQGMSLAQWVQEYCVTGLQMQLFS